MGADAGERMSRKRCEPIATTEEEAACSRPRSMPINKRDHEEMFLSVGRALGIPTDRAAAVQRLRIAPGARQSLHRGRGDLHLAAAERPAAAGLRGWRAAARLRACAWTSPTPSRRCSKAIRQRLGRLQRRQRAGDHGQRDRTHAGATPAQEHRAARSSTSIGSATSATASPTSRRSRSLTASSRRRDFEAGMAELIRWTETARRPVDALHAAWPSYRKAEWCSKLGPATTARRSVLQGIGDGVVHRLAPHRAVERQAAVETGVDRLQFLRRARSSGVTVARSAGRSQVDTPRTAGCARTMSR